MLLVHITHEAEEINLRLDDPLKLFPVDPRDPGELEQAPYTPRDMLLDAKLVGLLPSGLDLEPGDGL